MNTRSNIRLLLTASALAVWQVAFGYTPPTEYVIREIPLPTNDIAFSKQNNQLLATVPSSAGVGRGNSVTHIDPYTGAILGSVFVGSEPGPIGLSDNGGIAYVGMDGSPVVRRYDVSTKTAGAQSFLGSDPFYGFFYAEDIAVKPGDPETFAVSRIRKGVSPRHGGVAAFVNGTQLPDTTQDHTGSNRIEFGGTPDALYGLNNESTEFGLRTLSLDATGVHETGVIGNLSGFSTDFKFEDGRLYASWGVVFDPALGFPVGTYSASVGSGIAAVEPDSSNGVSFGIESDFGTPIQLSVFDQETFVPIGAFSLIGVSGIPTDLVSMGDAGLALRTDDYFGGNSRLYLLTPVPEPGSWAMIATGCLLLTMRLARRASH